MNRSMTRFECSGGIEKCYKKESIYPEPIDFNNLSVNMKSDILSTGHKCYFQLFPYSHGSSACFIWQIFFTPHIFSDTNSLGFVSPLGIKLGIFHLLGKCVKHSNTLWNR